MAEITLVAELGRPVGTRSSGRLRSMGKIPGVIYGHGIDPMPVAVEGRELRHALTGPAGLNTLLALQVDGATHLTLAREIQRHPVRGTVTHVDFLVVRRDEVVSADVPVQLVGDAIEVHRADGLVEQQVFSLPVHATPDRIPSSIEVDVTALRVGDMIRVGDLQLPEGVTTEVDAEDPVVVAQAPAALVVEEAPPVEEGAVPVEGEEPVAEGGEAGEG